VSAPLLVGGARRLVRQRTRRHRGHPPSFAATGVGRLVLPRLAASADGHRDEALSGASIQGDCGRQRQRSRPRQRAPRGRAAEPVEALAAETGHRWSFRHPLEGATKPVTATPRGGKPLGLVSTAAKRNARMPQGTRAAEVDALVSAPLRPESSGPGIRTAAEQLRLSFGRGPRPIATTPCGLGRERFSSRLTATAASINGLYAPRGRR